jgi:hypothetical protein
VLGSTLYFAFNAPSEGVDYVPIIDALLKAGADVKVVNSFFPTGNVEIDDVLGRHGARREG